MVQKLDFITPTLIQVLDVFMTDPLQEHHEREVMRMAGVSKGSANRILHELSGSGFLTVQKKGRMVFYKLNLKDPSARQFKILSNVYSLKELLEGLQRYSRRIILFGSCAQGTDVKESEVDLMVLTDQKNAARKEINRFNSKEKRTVVPIIVDANELAKMKREDGALYENIERGILLWETEDLVNEIGLREGQEVEISVRPTKEVKRLFGKYPTGSAQKAKDEMRAGWLDSDDTNH